MLNNFEYIKSSFDKNNYTYFPNEEMKKHTTFGIGGKVKLLIYPKSIEELSEIIKTLSNNNIRIFYIGSGSNILISDENLDCAIISLKKTFKKIIFKDNTVIVESGVMLGSLVKKLSNKNITGFESLIGVPGTVGGALFMNAGAFGSEISNNFISARTLNNKGKIQEYDKNNITFSYRKSSFPNNEILIDMIFNCKSGDREKINAKKNITSISRKNKQPLKYRSAGSIFKNPNHKYAAGYLIEKSNLKGLQIGNAQISEKHANFIINIGNAKAKDVMQLIKIIKLKVYETFNVKLELEIKLIGINES